LIQRDFLESGHTQNLQKTVEWKFQSQLFLDDGDQGKNCDRHPDLRPHRVLGGSVERLDPQVLFDPSKKQFDLPAELVELGSRQGGLKNVVRQENQVTAVFAVVKTNPAKGLGIVGFGLEPCQDDRLIGAQVRRFVDRSRHDALRTKVGFGSDDEKSAVLMKRVEACEIQITAVQNIEGSGLDGENVEDSNIVRFSIGHMDKRGNRTSQIEKSMKFDGSFVLAELGPREKRQTQVDGRGIEGVGRLFEHQADIFVAVKSTGFGDEPLGEIGIDPPIARFVGVSQVAARDAAANAHVIEPVFHRQKTSLDIAEAFPISQLSEGKAKELIEAEEVLDLVVPAVAPNALSKIVHRKEGHDLGEDGRLSIHRALLEGPKSADYTKSRSNRSRSESPVSSIFCAC